MRAPARRRALPKVAPGLDAYSLGMSGLRGTHHNAAVLGAAGLVTGASYQNIGGKVVLIEYAYKANTTTLTGEQLIAWANKREAARKTHEPVA